MSRLFEQHGAIERCVCELNAACISIHVNKAQRLACAACFESVVATIAVNYYYIHVHDTRFLVTRVDCAGCLLIRHADATVIR